MRLPGDELVPECRMRLELKCVWQKEGQAIKWMLKLAQSAELLDIYRCYPVSGRRNERTKRKGMAVAHFEMWGFAFRSLMRKVADGSIRRAILLLAAMGVALLDAGSFTLVSGYGMSVRVRRRSTLLRTSEMDLPSSTSAGVGYDAGKL